MRRARGYRKAAPALLVVGALLPAASASAAVTIGQLPPDAPPASCPADYDYLQDGVTGGSFYTAQEAGTITSWTTRSSGAGARYDFKVFRRTSDPDVFRVVGRATGQTLSPGVNTFRVGLHVDSGDLIGLHEQGGGFNSCTFPLPGDAVLRAAGNLGTGGTAHFTPVTDVRLNLRAVLAPANDFTVTAIRRNRHRGTATLTLETSNPGIVTVGGKGLKKRRPAKSLAVAGPVSFAVALVGKRRHRLTRRGKLTVPVTVTFAPTDGDPSSQTIPVRLKQKKGRPPESR